MAQDPWALQTSYGVASGSGTFSGSVTESLAQLESLWIAAGGPTSAAPEAAAIAKAESGGQALDYNATQASGDQSFGLWQINVAPNAHPGYLTQAENATIFSPAQNAADAVAVYKSSGFGAWSSTKSVNGAAPTFEQFLGLAPDPSSTEVATAVAAQPTPPNYSQNPIQAGITHLLVGPGVGGNANGTAGVSGTSVGTTSAAPLIPGDMFGANAALATLQTSWSTFWAAHPATIIVAGVVLALIAWALLAGGGGSNVNVSLAPAAAAA